MKPKNFPARKLRRKLIADGKNLNIKEVVQLLEDARAIRTKKDRRKQK